MARPNFSKHEAAPPQSAPDSQYSDTSSSSRKPIAPNWLNHWSRRRKGEVWGFVGFYVADEARREEFEEEVRRIIGIQFGGAGSELPDYDDARAKFEIRWIEHNGAVAADADTLRKRYAEMRPDLPSGLAQELFLCATPEAVDSVLAPDTTDRPTAASKWWRADAPFLVAIAADTDPGLEEGHEERDWFRPVFKVAAETLVEELWWLLDSDIMPLRRITRYTKGHGERDAELEDIDLALAGLNTVDPSVYWVAEHAFEKQQFRDAVEWRAAGETAGGTTLTAEAAPFTVVFDTNEICQGNWPPVTFLSSTIVRGWAGHIDDVFTGLGRTVYVVLNNANIGDLRECDADFNWYEEYVVVG
ncbi:hypothetical protein F5Y13DRAFT_192409 [Hypoxylon sp. FL1857]|nr:hypothetical protein F5Y13DRAFT_192409 [Hypoxylon sp. FL1857]